MPKLPTSFAVHFRLFRLAPRPFAPLFLSNLLPSFRGCLRLQPLPPCHLRSPHRPRYHFRGCRFQPLYLPHFLSLSHRLSVLLLFSSARVPELVSPVSVSIPALIVAILLLLLNRSTTTLQLPAKCTTLTPGRSKTSILYSEDQIRSSG